MAFWDKGNKFPYTNNHDANLDYMMTIFENIKNEWHDLYVDLVEWKGTTTLELNTWKTNALAQIEQYETDFRAEIAVWKATTEQDIGVWEQSVLADLGTWRANFETLFATTFTNLSQIKTDAEAARDAAALSADAALESAEEAESSAESVSSALTQISTNAEDISDLKTQLNEITGNEIINFTPGYYIKTNDSPVNPSSPVPLAGCEYAVVDCQPGDKFTINAIGSGSVAHCYCFLDSSGNNILSELYSTAGVGVTGLVIQAPANAVKLCINSKTTFDTLCYKNSPVKYSIGDLSELLGYERVGEYGLVDGYYIRPNGTKAAASTFAYTKPIFISKGNHIVYTATGGPSATSIAVTSDGGTTFTACAGFTQNGIEEKIEYTTIEDGYYSFVFLKANRHYAFVSTINLNNAINTSNKNMAVITAILRNSGTGWEILDDSDHEPVNVSSVEVTSGGSLKLNYSITAKNVLSLIIAPDETFAKDYFIGGSVGLTDATFNIFKNGHNIGGLVRYSGGTFNVGYSSFTSAEWDSDTSTLKVYHPTVAPWDIKDRFDISVNGYGIDAKLVSAGADYIAIQFYKNGNIVTTPDNDCQVCANRFMNTVFVNADNVVSANGNFWVIGLMEI